MLRGLTLGLLALLAGCDGCDAPAETGSPTGTGVGVGTGAGGHGAGGGTTTTGTDPEPPCQVIRTDAQLSDGLGISPSIAWSGDEYGVAWSSTDADAGDIAFALVDRDGEVLTQTIVADGPAQSKTPSVVHLASGDYLVLWHDVGATGSTAMARYVDADGKPKGLAMLVAPSASDEARPSAAEVAGGVAVAWMDEPQAYLGVISDSAVTKKSPINPGRYPFVTRAGQAGAIVWASANKLGFARFTDPLSPLEPTWFRDVPGGATVPRLAAASDGSLMATWEDSRGENGDVTVYAAPISKDGVVGAEVRVPAEPGSADYPDVVMMDDHAVVAYYQFRDGPPSVYVARIARDGAVDGDLMISGDRRARLPRMAWTGAEIGVVYAETDGPVRMAIVACKDGDQ